MLCTISNICAIRVPCTAVIIYLSTCRLMNFDLRLTLILPWISIVSAAPVVIFTFSMELQFSGNHSYKLLWPIPPLNSSICLCLTRPEVLSVFVSCWMVSKKHSENPPLFIKTLLPPLLPARIPSSGAAFFM